MVELVPKLAWSDRIGMCVAKGAAAVVSAVQPVPYGKNTQTSWEHRPVIQKPFPQRPEDDQSIELQVRQRSRTIASMWHTELSPDFGAWRAYALKP